MVKNHAEISKNSGFIFCKNVLNLGFFMLQNISQLYSELNVSKRFLLDLTSNPQKFYKKIIRPKKKFGTYQEGKNGSLRLRHLIPPVHSLKIIQSKIRDYLQQIELPDCMYGSVTGRNNAMNALQHTNNIFFLKIDLKNYFSNISNKQVHHALLENQFSWEVSRIITKLITYQCSLPQGTPTSPVIANLVFAKTATQLKEFIKNHGLTFTVFLDDIVFSSKKDFKELVPGILDIIRGNGFFPHNNKISYRKYTCEITGLQVGNGKLKIVPRMKKAALKNARVKGYVEFVNKCYRVYSLNKSNIKPRTN